MRLFYLRFFTPYFESRLRTLGKCSQLRLIPRHSVTEPDGFNIFLSDLDFTIVLKSTQDNKPITDLTAIYFRFSKTYPFIGELEIYTESEWILKNKIESTHGQLIHLIWKIRKFHWQKTILQTAKTNYHKYKAFRSIERIKNKLKISSLNTPQLEFSSLFEKTLSDILPAPVVDSSLQLPRVSGKSNYLEWEFSNINLLLLAILPDGIWSCPLYKKELTSLRSNPEVLRALSAVCAYELIVLSSKNRAYDFVPDPTWPQNLNQIVSSTPEFCQV